MAGIVGTAAGAGNIELAAGTTEPILEVKETLTLLKPDGTRATGSEKILTERSRTPVSSKFENTYTFKIPSAITSGNYAIRMAVVVNQRVLKVETLVLQLVRLKNGDTGFIARR